MMHALGGPDLPSSRLAEADPDKPVTLPVHHHHLYLIISYKVCPAQLHVCFPANTQQQSHKYRGV